MPSHHPAEKNRQTENKNVLGEPELTRIFEQASTDVNQQKQEMTKSWKKTLNAENADYR